ncbi:MAG: tRNA preQ1(34) S-adenosylmethionine ribosyltransferase-isomerase QueA [Thermoleophilia bacterium]|jgi:S-adenosylmethionine:tRNA ribosyltransferase-isomerase
MLTSELDYDLPPGLIAQTPIYPRDHSRLLVFDRARAEIHHGHFPDLLHYLNPGDVLVYNDSRVLKARVFAIKPTGGHVELLFLKPHPGEIWEALVKPSARLKEGSGLKIKPQAGTDVEDLASGHHLQLKKNLGSGRWLVKNTSGVKMETLLERVGKMPLPPYIKEALNEPERYQTVYASEPGSAAAPTAGLHFTQQLLSQIEDAGSKFVPLTLDIGLDTFRPVSEVDLSLHQIHNERYRLSGESHMEIAAAKERGGKVISVGTTAARVLETVFAQPPGPLQGETRLFITPGHSFKAVDALLTNFHLPRSTLLALVMAFTGKDETHRIYKEAVRERYRFYSFGDAMLVV